MKLPQFHIKRSFSSLYKSNTEFNIWKKNRRIFVILNESYEIQERASRRKIKLKFKLIAYRNQKLADISDFEKELIYDEILKKATI